MGLVEHLIRSRRSSGFDPFPKRCTPAFPFDLEPLTHMLSHRNPYGPGFLIDADLVGLVPYKNGVLAFDWHELCGARGVLPRPKVNPGRTRGFIADVPQPAAFILMVRIVTDHEGFPGKALRRPLTGR
jgi:hypothetical protein